MKKILVTYLTRIGWTAETAKYIGEVLAEYGADVTVIPMDDVRGLDGYDAVIAGSSINGSEWLPAAIDFVRENRAALAAKPFAIFTLCINLAMMNYEQYLEGIRDGLSPVRQLVTPLSEGYFPGKVDAKSLVGKSRLSLNISIMLGVLPRGARREWEAARVWVEELAGKLDLTD